MNRIRLIRRAEPSPACRMEQSTTSFSRTVNRCCRALAMHVLHIGLLLAVSVLALKAAFMPPRLQVTLHPGESAMLQDDVLVLKGFSVPKYCNGRPRQYVSDVHMVSMERGVDGKSNPQASHAKISVNHPLRWNGWWIYQNSYDAANEAYTVLEAVRDPFLPLAVLAGVLLLLGTAMMCLEGRSALCGASAGCVIGADSHCGASRWAGAFRFAAAAAVVMLPLWIIGKVLLTRELVPALQSPLLVPHVGAYLVSYAILIFAAFGIGTRLVPFGFFLMTLALVLGATWGKVCWGDWWQYDPKEMWSLATWLTFAAYFHFRRSPKAAKWLLRFGMLMIVLTLTWVNFARIFKGLHSYV